jgi:23S rRNA (guanine745-N1)-methyltransferase
VHPAVIAQLRCPVCRRRLSAVPGALRCESGHSFDLARQGYADLTAGRPGPAGDSSEMVAARERLLSAGHYRALEDAVRGAALRSYQTSGMILDAGAGTGHYLAAVLERNPDLVGLAVDVSKPALRRAARAHPRMAAVRADVWRGLPVADGAAAVVLDVFAPRSGAEFARVLARDGRLVVVTPEPDHLVELVRAAKLLTVDPEKPERLAATLEPHFTRASDELVADRLRLTRDEATALITMGPSARHVSPTQLSATLAELPEPIDATLSVRVSVWGLPH